MELLSRIAAEKPDFVVQGEAARLFPVLDEHSKERRAASVLLASVSMLNALADVLLRRIGRPLGKRARVNCFTEVVLKSDEHDARRFRPDGLIIVNTGRDTWSALVECKVGKAKIDRDQLEAYLRKARENNINCVITISNELVADPSHPPIEADGRLTKSVKHFHYSWLTIRSDAELTYSQSLIDDADQTYVLAELIRFLRHASAGVEGFTQMPAKWDDLVRQATLNMEWRKGDPAVAEIARAWLQEERELTINISDQVKRSCRSRTQRRLRKQEYDPLLATIGELTDRCTLSTEIEVPEAAAEIELCANLKGRTTTVSMLLRAPADKKRPESRLNWLLSQLKNADPANVEIRAHWPGRAKITAQPLERLRANPKAIVGDNDKLLPHSFEVVRTIHNAKSFSSRRKFISELEAGLAQYYENIGQRLSAWSPKAPTVADESAAERIERDTVIEPATPAPEPERHEERASSPSLSWDDRASAAPRIEGATEGDSGHDHTEDTPRPRSDKESPFR